MLNTAWARSPRCGTTARFVRVQRGPHHPKATVKRSTDTAQPVLNRRAMVRNPQSEFLQGQAVQDFLDGHEPDTQKYRSLERKFVLANEPALLLELIGVTGESHVQLSGAYDAADDMPPLPDGLFEFFAEHINEVPCVTSFSVADAVLTAQACTKLQASLNAHGCELTELGFVNCSFADAHVNFIADAPTIDEFTWSNEYDQAPHLTELDRVLPALANWKQLDSATLRSIGAPLNYTTITTTLLANPRIAALDLHCDTAPASLGSAGQPTPGNPVALFEALRNNRTGLTQLNFQVAVPDNPAFAELCMQWVARAMTENTRLQTLELPGVALCSDAFRQSFEDGLQRNRSLTALGPRGEFSRPMRLAIEANARRHLWFSQDFIRGALGEFMRLKDAPKEVGALVARHLYSTPYEQTYCGAIVALLCKATQAGGVQVRSAGLREAIKERMRSHDQEGCLELLNSLSPRGMGLLPADKTNVVHFATTTGRLAYLPAGYAG